LASRLNAYGDPVDRRMVGAPPGTVSAVPAPSPPAPEDSKSFVVETLLKGFARDLPEEQHALLVPYLEAGVNLDGGPQAENRRGEQCVAWVREVTESEHRGGLGRLEARVLEDAREVIDAVDSALNDVQFHGQGTPAGFHEQLNRSFAALHTAEKLADKEGWSEVPWRALLDRVCGVKKDD
jgi:hypothetical protein